MNGSMRSRYSSGAVEAIIPGVFLRHQIAIHPVRLIQIIEIAAQQILGPGHELLARI